MGLKKWGKRLLRHTGLYPVHMGQYMRQRYFWREVGKLPVHSFKAVLDAGCGSGHYAQQFAHRYPFVKVLACDIEDRPALQGVHRNVSFERLDLRALRKPECFDFIWSIDVLEHIPGNREVIRNFQKALHSGGYLYIHMPSAGPYRRILPTRWFAEVHKRILEVHVGEHYLLKELCDILREEGFQITHAQWTFGFLGELAWEIDQLTDRVRLLKAALTPVLKMLALSATRRQQDKTFKGSFLVVGRKL